MSSLSQHTTWSGLSLRAQLLAAMGLLTLFLTVALMMAVFGMMGINNTTRRTIEVDGQLTQIANDVALNTLLCRRYEKEILLNLDNGGARAAYVVQWNTAFANLTQALDTFERNAVTENDRYIGTVWRTTSQAYSAAFAPALDVRTRITPDEANAALRPVQGELRTLTDSAVRVARQKRDDIQQVNRELIQANTSIIRRVIALGIAALLFAIAWSLLLPHRVIRPLIVLQNAADRIANGDLSVRTPTNRHDELGQLAKNFNHMAATIQDRTELLETQFAVIQQSHQKTEHARAALAEQLAIVEQQREAIREMSVPILPINATTLVMPLVGALDTERLRLAQEQALQAIERTSAQRLILDITGVPIVDTQVAQGLIQIVRAGQLLGAEVMLVGIRPEVAQAIVGLGIDLHSVATQSSLQSGLALFTQPPATKQGATTTQAHLSRRSFPTC